MRGGSLQAAPQPFHEEKGEEAAEDMAPDGLVGLVEDGPGFKNALHLPEDLFHVEELLVLESHRFRRKIRVRPENPLPVVSLIFFHLVLIDEEVTLFTLRYRR